MRTEHEHGNGGRNYRPVEKESSLCTSGSELIRDVIEIDVGTIILEAIGIRIKQLV